MKRQNLTIRKIQSLCMIHLAESDNIDRNNFWGYFVLRRASYYLAWLCLKLGISANAVTYFAFTIGFTGCIFLAFGSYGGMIVGALLVNICALLDYVDGNVARGSNSSGSYGKFLDSLGDFTISVLLFMSIGVGTFNHPDPYLNSVAQSLLGTELDRSIFLFLGGWAAVFSIFPFLISYSFERTLLQPADDFVANLKVRGFSASLIHKVGFNLNSTTGLIMPILLLSTIFRFLSVVVFLWALILTFASIFIAIQMLRKGMESPRDA